MTLKELIQSFEGCSLRAYLDLGGKLTIGYGCTRDVAPGQVITPEEAEKRLEEDITHIIQRLSPLILVPLTDTQLNACVSLAFNIGIGAFSKSTLLKKLNNGDYRGASKEFIRWCYVHGGYSPGLEKRRRAEQALFNTAHV